MTWRDMGFKQACRGPWEYTKSETNLKAVLCQSNDNT